MRFFEKAIHDNGIPDKVTMNKTDANNVLADIELMHLIRKGQRNIARSKKLSFADQFYALTGEIRPA